jgi:two-component SAPR family response regulator
MANSGTIDGRIRVAVVDEDEDLRLRLKDILGTTDNLSFAGGFLSATEALSGILRLRPDVALVNMRLPDIDGIECAKQIRHLLPGLSIILSNLWICSPS